jgi:hypothetical protein
MTDLGPNERRLLRALRAADEPSDDDRARVRARVLLKVAAASGVASALATTAANAPGAAAAAGTAAGGASIAPGAAATASTLAGFAAGSWKIGAAIVTVVGAVGGAAWIATAPKADPPPHTAPRIADQPVQPPAKAAPSEANRDVPKIHDSESAAASTVQKSSRSRSRSPDPPASANGKADELDSELALLTDAQRALKQGDSEGALAALDQHESEHPDGALARERAGIRAVALCESGKITEGKREARRFLSRNPKSPLAVRVRAACLGAKK